MNINTTLGELELEHPIMNAAGTCKTLEDVRKLAGSAVSAIVVGSITVEPRAGNEGEVFWSGPAYSLNSLGLPNRGKVYYEEHLEEMAGTSNAQDKPLIASVAGFSHQEYLALAYSAIKHWADHVELNLGCPNVWEDGRQKRIASFDPIFIDELLEEVNRFIGPVAVKLSPFSDPKLLEEVALVIGRHKVSYVATSNTLPNALSLHNDRPVINAELAGMGSAGLKPIAMGQVAQLRRFLPDGISIVGVGGVACGQDVRDYLRAGASAVQAASTYFQRGEDPGVFGEILSEYLDLVPSE